jgi:hypothetical protein
MALEPEDAIELVFSDGWLESPATAVRATLPGTIRDGIRRRGHRCGS